MRSAAAGTVRATTSVTRSIACGRAGSDGLVRPFEQPTERVTELVGLDRLRQERVEALGHARILGSATGSVKTLMRRAGETFSYSQTVTHPVPYCFFVHLAAGSPVRCRTSRTCLSASSSEMGRLGRSTSGAVGVAPGCGPRIVVDGEPAAAVLSGGVGALAAAGGVGWAMHASMSTHEALPL